MELGEEVLNDLDATIDALIANANTLRELERKQKFETEVQALKKTQESLLARILHRQQLLDEKRRRELTDRAAEKEELIDRKIEHFEKLNTQLLRPITDNLIPVSTKRRSLSLSRRRKRDLKTSSKLR